MRTWTQTVPTTVALTLIPTLLVQMEVQTSKLEDALAELPIGAVEVRTLDTHACTHALHFLLQTCAHPPTQANIDNGRAATEPASLHGLVSKLAYKLAVSSHTHALDRKIRG